MLKLKNILLENQTADEWINNAMEIVNETNAGWLNPQGELIATDRLHHYEILKKNSKYKKMIDEYEKKFMDSNQEYYDVPPEIEKNLEGMGQPHEIDMLVSNLMYDLRARIYVAAYQDGWIRIIVEPYNQTITAEGLRQSLENRKTDIKDLKYVADAGREKRYKDEFELKNPKLRRQSVLDRRISNINTRVEFSPVDDIINKYKNKPTYFDKIKNNKLTDDEHEALIFDKIDYLHV